MPNRIKISLFLSNLNYKNNKYIPMKKIYFITLLLFTQVTFSQNFSYPIGQHIVADIQAENYDSYGIDLNTPSPEPIQYKFELISNTFPSAWSYSLCAYGTCYVGVPGNGTMTAITQTDANNGVIGWFKLNLTVGQNYGQGIVKLYVYDSNDYNRGDTVSWNLSWLGSSASMDENKLNETVLYPNPTSNFFTLSIDGDYNGTIVNSLGQEVKKISGTKLTQQSINDLQTGIYFVNVATQFGTLSRRLIVK